MSSLLLATLRRDLSLSMRRRTEALLPLAFFLGAAALFAIGVGPEPQTLRDVAPGVVWVCALFAALLSMAPLFGPDHADGSLDQMALAPQPLAGAVMGKMLAHWTAAGLPLVLVAPLLGLLFDLHAQAITVLALSLLLGTPVLSLLGAVGAALTLGLRNGGMLLLLLVMPLAIPTLIFGTGAVSAAEAGQSARPHLSLLAALLIVSALGAPLATAAALRISLD